MKNNATRCAWAGTDPLYVRYHDEEWGVPVHDDRRLFEMLILEGHPGGFPSGVEIDLIVYCRQSK